MAKKVILWALNPFQKNPQLHKNAVALLSSLVAKGGYSIEPVYVVSPAEVNVVLEFSLAAKNRFEMVARRECEKVLKTLRLKGQLAPKILLVNQVRMSASAETLAAYAKKRSAAAILLGTHGRTGLKRVLLGSFAETLAFHSNTPLLLVNPQLKKKDSFSKVLFASDFSSASRRVFQNFCQFAAPFKPSVLLFHVLSTPFPWASQATEFLWGGEAVSIGEYLKLLKKIREKESRFFSQVAKKHGLKIQLAIEPSGEDVATSILQKAKQEKAQAIAMAAQTGKWETAILGAASRGVIREAEVPVWVQRV